MKNAPIGAFGRGLLQNLLADLRKPTESLTPLGSKWLNDKACDVLPELLVAVSIPAALFRLDSHGAFFSDWHLDFP